MISAIWSVDLIQGILFGVAAGLAFYFWQRAGVLKIERDYHAAMEEAYKAYGEAVKAVSDQMYAAGMDLVHRIGELPPEEKGEG